MIRVVIADDHKIFRDGLKLLFRRQKHIELVGEAANGRELVALVKEHTPDIVFTDIKMPEMDGIAAVKEIQQIKPGAQVIALSMFDEESLVKEMFEAGAMGYLLKDAEKEEILEAIEQVRTGNPCFSRTFSPRLVQLLASSNYNPYSGNSVAITEKERELIECIMEDLTSKEIAERMNLSARTIEWHKQNLMEKMKAKSTTGIVVYAIKHGLVRV
jgi:two-component system response regulator NreC